MSAEASVREPIPGVCYMPPARLRAYVEHNVLPTRSLVEALFDSFARHADRAALHTPSGAISYAELDAVSDRLGAAFLDLGLEPLDRVLFQSANTPRLVIALLACFKAGLIPICTLAAHREAEIGYLGCHCDARLHIVQGDDPKFDLQNFALKMRGDIPTMHRIVALDGTPQAGVHGMDALIASQDARAAKTRLRALARDRFQVAVFQLSGGTTGVPKVIPRTQADYLMNAELTASHLGYRADDVMFMPMPIMHNACMICFLLPTLLSGASFVIAAEMTPQAWAAAFAASPPSIVGMVRALLPRYDAMREIDAALTRQVRSFWCPDAAGLVRRKYDVLAYGMFGMTEGMNMYPAADDPIEVRDETVGRPLSEHDEIRLVRPGTADEVAEGEVGEMTVRGPYTIVGYFNTPERNQASFTADGFYRSGDLMVKRIVDGRPCYAFAGRNKDIINRAHEKISCEEIEQLLVTHPAVADCALVGVPDNVMGERACACLVLKPGQVMPDVAALGAFLQTKGLARFKWPERVQAFDALPLTKVGKLDKAALRTRVIAAVESESAS